MKIKYIFLFIIFDTILSSHNLVKNVSKFSLSKTTIGLTMLVGILSWKLLQHNKEISILKLNQNNPINTKKDILDVHLECKKQYTDLNEKYQKLEEKYLLLKSNEQSLEEASKILYDNLSIKKDQELETLKSENEKLITQYKELKNKVNSENNNISCNNDFFSLENDFEKFNNNFIINTTQKINECEINTAKKIDQIDKDLLLNQQTTDLRIENSKLKQEILLLNGQLQDAKGNSNLIELIKKQKEDNQNIEKSVLLQKNEQLQSEVVRLKEEKEKMALDTLNENLKQSQNKTSTDHKLFQNMFNQITEENKKLLQNTSELKTALLKKDTDLLKKDTEINELKLKNQLLLQNQNNKHM